VGPPFNTMGGGRGNLPISFCSFFAKQLTHHKMAVVGVPPHLLPELGLVPMNPALRMGGGLPDISAVSFGPVLRPLILSRSSSVTFSLYGLGPPPP